MKLQASSSYIQLCRLVNGYQCEGQVSPVFNLCLITSAKKSSHISIYFFCSVAWVVSSVTQKLWMTMKLGQRAKNRPHQLLVLKKIQHIHVAGMYE